MADRDKQIKMHAGHRHTTEHKQRTISYYIKNIHRDGTN